EEKAHICVLVHNMDEAIAQLEAKGLEMEDVNENPTLKACYLKSTDPGGYHVHLLWNPSVT
ncbi:unnamed protein product, partial [marine sediment metagenome]